MAARENRSPKNEGDEALIRDFLAERINFLPSFVVNLQSVKKDLEKEEVAFVKISRDQGGPTAFDLIRRILAKRNLRGLESFHSLELIDTEFALLDTGKGGFQPSADILMRCPFDNKLFVVEVKRLVGTERQAVTELSAYSHGLHNRFWNLSPRDLAADVKQFLDRDTGSYEGTEGLAFDKLHGDVTAAGGIAYIVNSDDIRMVECGSSTSLTQESLDRAAIAEVAFGKQLDRHRSSEPEIARAIDLTHAAGSEHGEDFILAEPCSGREGHGVSRLYRVKNRDLCADYAQTRSCPVVQALRPQLSMSCLATIGSLAAWLQR